MKILNGTLALVFALFAALQYHDSDPLGWILVYGAVALCCLMAALGRSNKWLVMGLTVVVAIWMLTLLPGFIHWLRMGMPTITGSMKAEEEHIEVVREFLGLFLALLAMLHLVRMTWSNPGA
jgi:hypothetical protein